MMAIDNHKKYHGYKKSKLATWNQELVVTAATQLNFLPPRLTLQTSGCMLKHVRILTEIIWRRKGSREVGKGGEWREGYRGRDGEKE